MKGFRWFIKFGVWKAYEPNDITYPTLEECEQAIYPEYKDGAGIDEVDSDDGIVTFVRHVRPATIQYYEEEDE